MKDTLQAILKECTVTGSTAFGVNEPGSDIDYIVPVHLKTRVFNYLSDNMIAHEVADQAGYSNDDFTSIKFGSYNLMLCDTNKCYGQWMLATHIMKESIKRSDRFRNLIRDKKERVNMFDVFYYSYGFTYKTHDNKEIL